MITQVAEEADIVRTLVRVMVTVAETGMVAEETTGMVVEETTGTTVISKSVIDLFHFQIVNK